MGILDDEVGVEYRKQSRTAFTRIGAGDRALYDEVECNADSSDPNAVLLRQAYDQQKRAEGGPSISAPPQQGGGKVALRLPGGVFISGEANAKKYLEKMESAENKAQRAHEVTMKDVRMKELEIQLAQIQAQAPTTSTTNAPVAKRKKKAPVVPAAIVKKTKPRKPQTQEQRLDKNRKQREKNAQKKTDEATGNENL